MSTDPLTVALTARRREGAQQSKTGSNSLTSRTGVYSHGQFKKTAFHTPPFPNGYRHD